MPACMTIALGCLATAQQGLTVDRVSHAVALAVSGRSLPPPKATVLLGDTGAIQAVEWQAGGEALPSDLPPKIFASLGLPDLEPGFKTGSEATYAVWSPIRHIPIEWNVRLVAKGNGTVRLEGLDVPRFTEPVLCLLAWPGLAERLVRELHRKESVGQLRPRVTHQAAFRDLGGQSLNLSTGVSALGYNGTRYTAWVDPYTGTVLSSQSEQASPEDFSWAGSWGLSTATKRYPCVQRPGPKAFGTTRTVVLSDGKTWVVAEHDRGQGLIRTKTLGGYVYATAPDILATLPN